MEIPLNLMLSFFSGQVHRAGPRVDPEVRDVMTQPGVLLTSQHQQDQQQQQCEQTSQTERNVENT